MFNRVKVEIVWIVYVVDFDVIVFVGVVWYVVIKCVGNI